MNINLFWENQQHHQPHHQPLTSEDHQLNKPPDHESMTHHSQTKETQQQYHHEDFKCHYCDINCNNEDELNNHQLLHSRRRPYSCDECGARFAYNSILLWHKKSHNGQLPFKCDECSCQFQQNSMLIWHKRKHRINSDENVETNTNQHNNNNVLNEGSIPTNLFYQQDTNNIHPTFHSLPGVSSMFSMPNIHSGPIIPVSNTAMHTVSLLTPREIDISSNIPPISIGTNNIQTISHPQSIIKLNNKSKPDNFVFRCDICSATFKFSEYLKSHIHTKHNTGHNNPYYQMDGNNHSLNWRSSIMKRKNYCEKQFKCDLCGAGFKSEAHMKSHRLEHTADRPYKCKQCNLSFTDQFLLDIHERNHQTTGRAYKCSTCGASFYRESQLEKHTKRHTGEFFNL